MKLRRVGCLALLVLGFGSSATAESLAEAFALPLPADLAARTVISHAVSGGAGGRIFAGYFADERTAGGLGPLHVLYRPSSGTLRHAALTREHVRRLGSVTRLDEHAGRILVGLHHTPSASTTLVLDAELDLRARLDGWVVATLPDGGVVFQRSMVHFAPTHGVGLAVYDPERDSTTTIYPPAEPTPLMEALSRSHGDVLEELGDDWCARRNHHCDPSRPDRSLGRIEVGDGTLAFVIATAPSPLRTDPRLYIRIAYLYDLQRGRLKEVGVVDGEPLLRSLIDDRS